MNYISKTRQSWSSQEDLELQKLLKKYGTSRKGWKEAAKGMKNRGFERSTKACRERYNYHLVDKSQNTSSNSELTEIELRHLFSLINTYGNKWSEIAKCIANRTDLEIKNNFYAHVKRIFRRLVKSAFQTKASTQQTQNIRPIFISSIFCNDHDTDPKLIRINPEVKCTFKQLIVNHQLIKLGAELDQSTIQQVRFVMDYLEKENLMYLEKLSEKKESKVQSKIKHQIQKTIDTYSTVEQDQQHDLLIRIQQRKPIFTTTTYQIEKNYGQIEAIPLENQKFNNNQLGQISQDYQYFTMGSTQQNQTFSQNLSLYFVPSNQNQQTQYGYYLDSFNSYQNQQI